jgi:hypothetical protein
LEEGHVVWAAGEQEESKRGGGARGRGGELREEVSRGGGDDLLAQTVGEGMIVRVKRDRCE